MRWRRGATQFEYAAGHGPRQKDLRKGYPALVSSITGELEPDRSVHRPQVDISFMAYPPYAHFRRPGQPAPKAGPRRADVPSGRLAGEA
ncbi:hypothetical protein FB465_1058 [Kitasatospora atroaurantiaca]|uniref:Uncharacterized protein n=1 Tax=Kitasatospora atroaurantiaca TaxID=285545 RepID=A0A561EKE8_9ACTN|nr:hypothetical protein FB465_1058 [Kitasatospora atroaurantiaca]